MPSTHQFVSARLKVDRAERHINELQAVLAAFLQTNFYRLWLDTDSEPGSHLIRYETEPLPSEIPLIIGDVVHNLWTVFDHIASEIARSINMDGARVHFPKHETRDRVAEAHSFALIVKAAPDLKDAILDQICPYKDGPHGLWELSKLDNVDKHKLLVPTIGITNLEGICALDENRNGITGARAKVNAGGQLQLASFKLPTKITDYGKPTFKVAFSEKSYFDGQPVVPTLIQLAQFVREAVGILERGYFGAKAA